MKVKNAPTWVAQIFLSGPIEVAKQILREEFSNKGCCVTIEPTLYVYTGGEETGYVVGVRSYPRFPADCPGDLHDKAMAIAETLVRRTFQMSAMVVEPLNTYWLYRDGKQ